jgi:hypothetical protein
MRAHNASLRGPAPTPISIAEFLNACQLHSGKLGMQEAQLDEHRHASAGGKKAYSVPL